MRQAIGTFISLLFFGAGFAAIAWLLTLGLTPASKRGRVNRWLVSWLSKGLIAPVLLWAVLNVGLSLHLQPFMPQVQAARNAGGFWIAADLSVVLLRLFLVCTYLGAVTFGLVPVSAIQAAGTADTRGVTKLFLVTAF